MFATSTTDPQIHEHSAPIDGAHRGRLEVRPGASRWTLRALPGHDASTYRDSAGTLLYSAVFRGRRAPEVHSHAGVVEVRYGWGGLFDWSPSSAEIALAMEIPWEIELSGGMSELRAELSDVTVSRIEVRGGMSDAKLFLGVPTRAVPIEITGGVSNVAIVRPKGVAVRLRVRGGASAVKLDRQVFGAVGGELLLASSGFQEGAPCYDVEVRGGASAIGIRETE